MTDISTGRQRGIVPFVDETTGRLPDQYIPQRIIDLQGNLEQAVTDASSSATAASQSASQAQSSATAADSSARAASTSSESAKTASNSATSSKDAAAQSASQASASAQAAETSKTNAATSAQAAETSKTNAASSASAAKISETNAAASATAAQQAVDGFGLEVGTTTTGDPGTDAVVEIEKTGTKYTASFTIPRGEAGPSGVNENVPLGLTSGVVAHATDAYPALPRKVQVHGRTVKNLWPAVSAVQNGVTFNTDETGLITISGTEITGSAYAFKDAESLAAGKTYVGIVSATVANLQVRVQGVLPNTGSQSVIGQPFTTSGTVIQIPAGTTDINCVFALEGMHGQTVNSSFRVMFVEGDTNPGVFVPSGVHTVEPEKLTILGENLLDLSFILGNGSAMVSDDEVVFKVNVDALNDAYTSNSVADNPYNDDTKYLIPVIPNSRLHFKAETSEPIASSSIIAFYGSAYNLVKSFIRPNVSGNIQSLDFDVPSDAAFISVRLGVREAEQDATITMRKICLSYTDIEYVPPEKIETNLPSDISLADGDTLAIDRDGTTRILHAEGEPTVLENVTLPELPAPTFNVYTAGGYIHPTVDVTYEQDINIVINKLEQTMAAQAAKMKVNQLTD